MQTVKDDLTGIRQFIVEKKIVSLKARDNLKVIPTPPFMRGIYSVAGFHSRAAARSECARRSTG